MKQNLKTKLGFLLGKISNRSFISNQFKSCLEKNVQNYWNVKDKKSYMNIKATFNYQENQRESKKKSHTKFLWKKKSFLDKLFLFESFSFE